MCSTFPLKASKLGEFVVLTRKLDFFSTFFGGGSSNYMYIYIYIYISRNTDYYLFNGYLGTLGLF